MGHKLCTTGLKINTKEFSYVPIYKINQWYWRSVYRLHCSNSIEWFIWTIYSRHGSPEQLKHNQTSSSHIMYLQSRRSIYWGLILSIFIVAQYIGNLGLVLGAVIGYWVDQLRFWIGFKFCLNFKILVWVKNSISCFYKMNPN